MSHRSRTRSDDITFPFVILVAAAAWTHRTQMIHIAYFALGIIGVLVLLKLSWKLLRSHQSLRFNNVDSMDGLLFEKYVAKLLSAAGYRNVSLTEKYDFGVDITAEKAGVRWGIQTKRHSGLVKANAVRQVVTGLKLYNCDRAMVITNSNYSAVARRLAQANNCVLIDRAGLNRLVRQECIL
jgi:HJR/Mrr/RecB family endonuclease